MSAGTTVIRHDVKPTGTPDVNRWECPCGDVPMLLGLYTGCGEVQISVGNRRYVTSGHVQTDCPRCRQYHVLDVR